MEIIHKITEKQLIFLETYLKKKKRYSDSEELLELMDHLISDFEVNGNGNLSQFLADNSEFIFNFKTNICKDIHWAYQRQLWEIFFEFFTLKKYLPKTLLLISVIFFVFIKTSITDKQIFLLLIVFVMLPTIYGFILTYHKKKKIRKLVSFKYLGNIFSLPLLLVNLGGLIKEYLITHKGVFTLYFLLAFGLNIAGIILVRKKKNQLLKKYKYLLD